MTEALLWIHPLMQVVAAVIGLLAMWQGWKRFAMHRGKKVLFPWKKHVRWGSVALILWTLGALGFYATHAMFGATHITGLHAQLTWAIIPLSLVGLGTGFVMNKYKKRRQTLPLIHGALNALLLVLVLLECWTGYALLDSFIVW